MTKDDQFLVKAGKLANVGLTVGGALAFLVFLSFFYRYSLTGQNQFGRSVDFVWYYALPLGAAILLLATTRLKPIHRVNLVVFCVTFSASVYAVELFLESRFSPIAVATRPVMNLLENSSDQKKYAAEVSRKFGVDVDARTALEVLRDLRKQGVDAVPIVTPSNNLFVTQPDGSIKSAINIDGREVLPLAGIAGRRTLLCNESGQWMDYQSDERGYNNSSEIWHAAGVDIAAVGDSFTHGYCVAPDKNFVAQIRQRYPATVNLGVAGDGPLLMLAKLNEFLPMFKPKTVLWFYYEGNDLTDLQIERKSALLRNYLNDGFIQKDLARQADIDREMLTEVTKRMVSEEERRKAQQPNAAIAKFVGFAKLTILRQRLGLAGGLEAGAVELGRDLEGPNMDVFRNIMILAKSRVEASGGRLYFVYLPEWARYAGYESWGKTKRNEVLRFIGSLGLPIVDIDPVFRAHGDPLSLFPFRGVGHYTEAGHRLVAEEVIRSLSSTNRGDVQSPVRQDDSAAK